MAAMTKAFQIAEVVVAGIVVNVVHIKACPGTSLSLALRA